MSANILYWTSSTTKEITFPAEADFRFKVKLSHGEIRSITASPSLSDQELQGVLHEVKANLLDPEIAEYGREFLFAHRAVTGSYRFQSVPMQIVPAPRDAPRPKTVSGQHPFVLEYPIRRCHSSALRMHRRYKNAVEWAWVLNAVLFGSIDYRSNRPRQMWASRLDEPDSSCHWSQEFYMVPGSPGITSALSEAAEPLQIVPAKFYFAHWGTRARNLPADSFLIPDNLDQLIAAFVGLDGRSRRRFLRAAAAVHYSRRVWDFSISSSFLSCVQAIETLTDRPPSQPCAACHRDAGPGPTKLFRETIERYRGDVAVDEKVLANLYVVRSAIAHGRYLLQSDEAPWGFGVVSSIDNIVEQEAVEAAVTLSKAVLRNWLLAHVIVSREGKGSM
jgi:hypothetical protein